MSTSVASVTKFFPTAQNGFTTTLASTIASGATTVPLNSVAGYSNGDTAVFVIEPTSATAKQTFTGVIDTSGVQVTSVVWTAGTNQTHTGGVTVVDYAAATHMSMVTKGLLVQHNQDGTHGAITSTGGTLTNPTLVGTLAAPNNVITAPMLTTSAIKLGYTAITSSFTTTNTTATQVTSLSVTVTIPAGGRSIKITAYTSALFTSSTTIAAYMTIWDGTVGSGTQLQVATGISPGGSGATLGYAVAIVTPSAGSKTYNVGLQAQAAATASLTAATTGPAFILVEVI